MARRIAPATVRHHVAELASARYEGRGAGYPGEERSTAYIARAFRRIGLRPGGDRGTYVHRFPFHPRSPPTPWEVLLSRNVVGLLTGRDRRKKDEVVVLGAHHDGQGRLDQADAGRHGRDRARPDGVWPSADDNASGVAALLEVARTLAEGRPRRSVLFVTFGAEEHALNGSIEYVRNPVLPWSHHKAMICLEKLGRVPQQSLAVAGSSTSAAWPSVLTRANAATAGFAEILLPEVIPDTDHYGFAARGVPAIVIGTAHEEDTHTPGDTAEKIDGDALALRAAYVAAVVWDLAGQDAPPTFTGRDGPDPGLVAVLASHAELSARQVSPSGSGLKVSSVVPRLPADRAGIEPGDLVIGVDGIPLTPTTVSKDSIHTAASRVATSRLSLTVLRDSETLEIGMDLAPDSAGEGVHRTADRATRRSPTGQH